ncbi:MAG: hypothetical protein ACT4NL_13390 [Pseudomarimonas sp.]
MARYKQIDMSPRFLPVVLEHQWVPGSFADALQRLIDLLDLCGGVNIATGRWRVKKRYLFNTRALADVFRADARARGLAGRAHGAARCDRFTCTRVRSPGGVEHRPTLAVTTSGDGRGGVCLERGGTQPTTAYHHPRRATETPHAAANDPRR